MLFLENFYLIREIQPKLAERFIRDENLDNIIDEYSIKDGDDVSYEVPSEASYEINYEAEIEQLRTDFDDLNSRLQELGNYCPSLT